MNWYQNQSSSYPLSLLENRKQKLVSCYEINILYTPTGVVNNCFDYCSDELPTLKELTLLKYTEGNKKKKVSIINEASHKWKDIASLICNDSNKMRVLEQQHQGNPNECLRQTLVDDFLNKTPQGYSQDWSGLIELLDDVYLETLSKKVKDALLST